MASHDAPGSATASEVLRDEELMDEFDCKLQQRYTCAHNAYTSPTMVAFSGRLSVTGEHLCFRGSDESKQPSFALPLRNVQTACISGGVLEVKLKEGSSVAFGFESGDAANNALALVEHLAGV